MKVAKELKKYNKLILQQYIYENKCPILYLKSLALNIPYKF